MIVQQTVRQIVLLVSTMIHQLVSHALQAISKYNKFISFTLKELKVCIMFTYEHVPNLYISVMYYTSIMLTISDGR